MNKKYFSPELEIRLLFEDILSNSGAEAEADADWLENVEEAND